MALLFMNWVWLWIAVIVVTVVIELFTVGLVSIWLTGGALAALILCLLGAPPTAQIIVFFVVTFVLIYFTRPLAVKYFNRKNVKTNYEDIIGKEVLIVEKVDNFAQTGKAVYNGMEWTARSAESENVFEKDEIAIVNSVEGVKLILNKR